MSLKSLTLFALLLTTSIFFAQDFSERWTGYFSYNNISALAYGNGKVYAAAQNAVFSYDIITDELVNYSTIEGLTGEEISAIHYSNATGILVVGYSSGLMDVVRENEEVLVVVDISNKTAIPPGAKRINDFFEYEGQLYISTGFGISLYDLERLEFDDSYFIGDGGSRLNVKQAAIQGDYLYAATETGGVRRALFSNENIIDFNNWSTVATGNWEGIVTQGSNLFALQSNNTLQMFNGTSFVNVASFDEEVKGIESGDDLLAVTTASTVFLYDEQGDNTSNFGQLQDYLGSYNTALSKEGSVFVGTQRFGLLLSDIGNVGQALQVLPDGPLRNDSFSVEALPDQLWVVFGDYSGAYNPFPLKRYGVSHLRKEEGWVNSSYAAVLNTNNMVNITVNPQNEEQVFISSYNSGLLEITEDVAIKLFDETNSGLSDIPINPTDVRINGAAFDNQGNLWMTNSQVENALARKNGEQIQGFSIEEVLPDYDEVNGYSDLVIGRGGNIYFGSSNRGLIGFNPSTNTFARISGEEASNLPIDDIRALAVDNSGTLWIGTSLGLRLLFGPSQMFDNPEIRTTPIVILENDIPVELLNDQFIQSIEVDGSNNKWVGTLSSGVFYFSADGQETLQQFNTTNSPLPSNNVQDITIDRESGEVYFATPSGLVSFSGSAVAPEEDLESVRAFPNPVRPGFNGNVIIDGLTRRANVKITDVTGNLVYEEVAEGGSIQWDTTAFGRHKVASGVYLILVTSSDALETKVAKLMIIR